MAGKTPTNAAAKVAKKTDKKKAQGSKKHGKKRSASSWSVYVFRALKQIHKETGLSSKAMRIFNSFCEDVFSRIAEEAASLVRINKSHTLSAREVQTAVRLVLPAELAKHAMAEGTKAVAKFTA